MNHPESLQAGFDHIRSLGMEGKTWDLKTLALSLEAMRQRGFEQGRTQVINADADALGVSLRPGELKNVTTESTAVVSAKRTG